MSFKRIQPIPTAEEIVDALPLPDDLKAIKEKRDAEIRSIFERKSDKFLLIIGPCSAHNVDAVCEYVNRLAKLQEQVVDKLVLVPRIYTNKPRTTGEGYKGMAHQPDPESEPDIVAGIQAIRQMQIRAFRESHLTAADEMLYPSNLPYVGDLLSYIAVGARSVENQNHRLTISGVDVPSGMKNPTGGDLDVMFNAIYAAQIPHVFFYNGWEVRTSGNPLAHSVLRGMSFGGRSIPNYHYEDLMHTAEQYLERKLVNPVIIVDTNHNNSNKTFHEQPRIGLEVMRSRRHSDLIHKVVHGLMVESYLVEGSQKPEEGVFGKSITDPCLGWEETDRFVKELAEMV
jgi:3-deoxy-7-phosphoheptulonate synthase